MSDDLGTLLRAFAETQRAHLAEAETLRSELLLLLDEVRAHVADWRHEEGRCVLGELIQHFRPVLGQLIAAHRLVFRLVYAEDVTDEEGKPVPRDPGRGPVN